MKRHLMTALALCLPGAVVADWAAQPYVGVSLLFDDNIRFTADDPQSSTGVSAKAGVVLDTKNDASETRVIPEVVARTILEDSDLNSVSEYLRFSTKTFGERSNLGLNLHIFNDTTRVSELEDSGLVSENRRRLYTLIGPSWEYLLTPLLSVDIKYKFEGIQYEDSGENGLNDYENQKASLDLKRRLTEDLDVVGRVFYGRYKVLELTNKATTVGAEAGWKKRVSPQFEYSLFAGGLVTDTTVEGKTDSVTGLSASASLLYKTEKAAYDLRYRASVSPSSTGEAYFINQATATLSGDVNAYLSWRVHGQVQDRKGIGDVSNAPDRVYASFAPELSYRITPDWSAKVKYEFYSQSVDGEDDSVRNRIYAGVEYRLSNRIIY